MVSKLLLRSHNYAIAFAISIGAMFFGGIDEEQIQTIRDGLKQVQWLDHVRFNWRVSLGSRFKKITIGHRRKRSWPWAYCVQLYLLAIRAALTTLAQWSIAMGALMIECEPLYLQPGGRPPSLITTYCTSAFGANATPYIIMQPELIDLMTSLKGCNFSGISIR